MNTGSSKDEEGSSRPPDNTIQQLYDLFMVDPQLRASNFSAAQEGLETTPHVTVMSTTSGSNRLTSPGEGESVHEHSAKKSVRNRQTWIFQRGYGKRYLGAKGMLVKCCFPGCDRVYSSQNGATSSFKRHLQKVHQVNETHGASLNIPGDVNISESSNSIKAQGEKSSELLSSPEAPEIFNDPKILKNIPLAIAQDHKLAHLFQADGLIQHKSDKFVSEVSSLHLDIQNHLREPRRQIKSLLLQQNSLCITLDTWSNLYDELTVGVIAHYFTCAWEPEEVPLTLYKLKSSTTGTELARLLLETFDEFQISSRVFTITTENSANLRLMIEELGRISNIREDFNFNPSQQHIPCLGYIINEVVNDALKVGPCSVVLDKEERWQMEGYADPGSIFQRLEKIRLGAAAIKSSPWRLGHYQNYYSLNKLEYIDLVVDSPSDWNATYKMVYTCIEAQAAYNDTCANCNLALLSLSDEDMEFLDQVREILGPFLAFSSRLSTLRYPTISRSLPLYDKMMSHLITMDLPHVQAARQSAISSLKLHYSKTYDQYIYPIAATMDPRIKFSHWRPPVYELQDCKRLTNMVRSYWTQHLGLRLDAAPVKSRIPMSRFDSIFDLGPENSLKFNPDELTQYLNEPTAATSLVSEVGDRDYWRRSALAFPCLAKMAQQFLAIPATSMPCESQLAHSKLAQSALASETCFKDTALARDFGLLHKWTQILDKQATSS